MYVVQPLNISFDRLSENLSEFEKEWKRVEVYEQTYVDALIQREYRLTNLFRNISHSALVSMYEELRREIPPGVCECHSRIVYGIPCYHQLNSLPAGKFSIEDIPVRWRLSTLSESNSDGPDTSSPPLPVVKPWMSCLSSLETAFHNLENDTAKTSQLVDAVNDLLSVITVDDSMKKMRLPSMDAVKSPGRLQRSKFQRSFLPPSKKRKLQDSIELYKPSQNKRTQRNGQRFPFRIHPDVDFDNVKDTFSPKGENYCGYYIEP